MDGNADVDADCHQQRQSDGRGNLAYSSHAVPFADPDLDPSHDRLEG
jgi:hypothetical protein